MSDPNAAQCPPECHEALDRAFQECCGHPAMAAAPGAAGAIGPAEVTQLITLILQVVPQILALFHKPKPSA